MEEMFSVSLQNRQIHFGWTFWVSTQYVCCYTDGLQHTCDGGGIWVLWDTQDSTQTCKRTCSAGNTITQTCKQARSAGAHYFGVNQFISVMQSSAKFQNL